MEGARVLAAGFPDDPIIDVVNAILERGGMAEVFTSDCPRNVVALPAGVSMPAISKSSWFDCTSASIHHST